MQKEKPETLLVFAAALLLEGRGAAVGRGVASCATAAHACCTGLAGETLCWNGCFLKFNSFT